MTGEGTAQTAESPDAQAASSSTDSDEDKDKAKDSKSSATTSMSMMSSGGGGGPEGVSVPIPDTFQFTGAATIRIPIIVPPGRNGMQPNLSLVYNSYQRNGWIGVGWSLDMGSIQRSTKRGLDYNGTDFVASLNGSSSELIHVSGGDYGAKIEESFSKYQLISATAGWVVTAKDGKKYNYGRTSDSRQENTQGVFKWCLDKVEDTNGNFMTITYSKDQGEIYLDKIEYTHHPNLEGTNFVAFHLEEGRPDSFAQYVTQSGVTTQKRLKTIDIQSYDGRSRAYSLSYATSGSTSRSLVSGVTEFGTDAVVDISGRVTGGTALPPMTLRWQEKTNSFGQDSQWGLRSEQYNVNGGSFKMADVNGDGLADVVYNSIGADGMAINVMISNGSGFEADQRWGVRTRGYNTNGGGFKLADVNGDGMADFIYSTDAASGYGVNVMLSTGTSFGSDTQWGLRTQAYNLNGGGFQMADVNGDGLADFIYSSDYQSGYGVNVLISNGTGFGTDTLWGLRTQPYNSNGGGFQMADLNGDGLADFIYSSDYQSGYGVNVLISNGSAFGTDTVWGLRTQEYNTNGPGFRMADLNGDGMADFVYCTQEASGYGVNAMVSNGKGFETDRRWCFRTQAFNLNGGGFKMGDVNGDGLADLIYSSYASDGYGINVMLSKGNAFDTDRQWGTRSQGYNYNGYGFRVADMDGDGMNDVIYNGDGASGYAMCAMKSMPLFPDLVSGVSNSIGGSYTFEYKPSSSYANGMLPFTVNTVSEITAYDGLGNQYTTDYTYTGGFYDAPSREFRGFEYAKQTNPDESTIETWYHQDEYFKGRQDRVELREPNSGPLLTKTLLTWDKIFLNSPTNTRAFVKLTQKRTESYDLQSGELHLRRCKR